MRKDWQRQPFSIKLLVRGFVIWLILNYAGLIHATEVRRPISEDALLDQFAPTSNFGSDTALAWGAESGNARRPWFKDSTIAGIPAGSTIDSVFMKIYFASVLFSNNDITCTLYACAKNAVENQVTWNIYKTDSNWTTAGGDFDTLIGIFTTDCGFGGACYVTFKLNASGTNFFQQIKNATRSNFGMIGVSNSGIRKEWRSSESAKPDSMVFHYTAGAASAATVILGKVFLGGVNIAK